MLNNVLICRNIWGSEYFRYLVECVNAVTYNTDHCQGKTRDGRLTSLGTDVMQMSKLEP